jgi:hypothetical protein
VLIVIGTLSEHLLAQDGNADDLAKEMLLRCFLWVVRIKS